MFAFFILLKHSNRNKNSQDSDTLKIEQLIRAQQKLLQ